MHGLDESENIVCGDMVIATAGDHDGEFGLVDDITYEIMGLYVTACYVVRFLDDQENYTLVDSFETVLPNHPPLLRVCSEEAAAMVTTVIDAIG